MAKWTSFLAFLVLVTIAAHFSGILAAHKGWIGEEVYQTAVALRRAEANQQRHPLAVRQESQFEQSSGGKRFTRLAETGPPILIPGGPEMFTDVCRKGGCLAVEFDRHGKVLRRWPWRPGSLRAAAVATARPLDYAGEDFRRDLYPISLDSFANGDLLITFNLENAFPYSFGLARVRPDGGAAWLLVDRYNHEPTIAPNGRIYAPYHVIRNGETYRSAPSYLRGFVNCRSPQKQYVDFLHILTSSGRVLDRVDLLDLLLKDPRYGTYLSRTVDACDPLHLNSVSVAGPSDGAEASIVEEGDILLSLRAPSVVLLLDARATRIKRLYSGSWANQHSAHFAGHGEFVLFDNMGGGAGGAASRVLAVELESGRERVIRAASGEDRLSQLSATAGDISVAPDQTRLLVSYTQSGRLIEIDRETGKVLSEYVNVHPRPSRSGSREARFKLFTAAYALDPDPNRPVDAARVRSNTGT